MSETEKQRPIFGDVEMIRRFHAEDRENERRERVEKILKGKKCFCASVEIEILIVADNKEEAEEKAENYMEEEIRNMDLFQLNVNVYPTTSIPAGWDSSSGVYGDVGNEDVEAGEALEHAK